MIKDKWQNISFTGINFCIVSIIWSSRPFCVFLCFTQMSVGLQKEFNLNKSSCALSHTHQHTNIKNTNTKESLMQLHSPENTRKVSITQDGTHTHTHFKGSNGVDENSKKSNQIPSVGSRQCSERGRCVCVCVSAGGGHMCINVHQCQ